MSGYTRTGLLLLMIAVVITLCGSLVAYGYYATINLTDLREGRFTSFLILLLPIAIFGLLASLIYLLGALYIYLGRKEFGEKHRKNISSCLIIIVVTFIVVLVFPLFTETTSFNWIIADHSQSTPNSTADYFRIQIMGRLVRSTILGMFSALVWVLALYNLENKKGRIIILTAFIILIISPIINGIGSYMIVEDWTTQGFFDDMSNITRSPSINSELISVSQWTGPTGIIMLLCSLLSYLLLFIALFIAYKRITTNELTILSSTEETSHQ